MATVLLYETIACEVPYTILNPIFEWRPNYFRGDIGQYRTIQVFLKNIGDSILSGDVENPLEIFPWDL